MLKFFDEKVIFNCYYGGNYILTFDIWNKTIKQSKKVKVWSNNCPRVAKRIAEMIKKLNAPNLERYVVTDINDKDLELEILCGKSILVFRMGKEHQYVERDPLNMLSIYNFLSKAMIISPLKKDIYELRLMLLKTMAKLGINNEKQGETTSTATDVINEDILGDLDIELDIPTTGATEEPKKNGNGDEKAEPAVQEVDIDKFLA